MPGSSSLVAAHDVIEINSILDLVGLRSEAMAWEVASGVHYL